MKSSGVSRNDPLRTVFNMNISSTKMIIRARKHMGTDHKPSVQERNHEVEMTNGLSVNKPCVLLLHNSISQISPSAQTFKIFLQPT